MKKLSLLFCTLFLLGALCLPAYAQDDYEMLENGDFEDMSLDWQKYYMATVDYCETAHTGNGAFLITNRQHSTDIARQYITDPLEYYGPGEYEFSAWVRLEDADAQPINLMVAIGVYCESGAKHWFSTDWVTVTSEWTYISATRYITWEGELDEAEFYLVSPMDGEEDQTKNFRDLLLDDCSMKPVDFNGAPYAPRTTEAPTTEPVTQAPTTEAPTAAPESSAEPESQMTAAPEEQMTDAEQPTGSIGTQTLIITITMIAVGIIMLGCAIALTVSYIRGKRNETSK